MAVTAGGRLYTWGWGEYGQLGHGDTGNRLVPTLVGAWAFGGSAVVMAACFIQRPIPTKRESAHALYSREQPSTSDSGNFFTDWGDPFLLPRNEPSFLWFGIAVTVTSYSHPPSMSFRCLSIQVMFSHTNARTPAFDACLSSFIQTYHHE